MSVFDKYPELIDMRESAEDAVVGKSAEKLARTLVSSVLQSRNEWADKLDEDTMIELATAAIAPILQSWKDN